MTTLSPVAEKPTVKTQIDIDAIVKTKLSPLPGSALRVLEYLRDVNVSTRKLAEAVGYDPSLTARSASGELADLRFAERR
jgi:HD-like signal output (HDOD) protein